MLLEWSCKFTLAQNMENKDIGRKVERNKNTETMSTSLLSGQ